MPKLTEQEATYYKDRLGDNWMAPADTPVLPWVLNALYEEGVTPDTFRGSDTDKKQYADYYAKRKAG